MKQSTRTTTARAQRMAMIDPKCNELTVLSNVLDPSSYTVGSADGCEVPSIVGTSDGATEGILEGPDVGWSEGVRVGSKEGSNVGTGVAVPVSI